MTFKIDVLPSAVKELRRLPPDVLRKVARHIDGLARAPHPPGSKKLKGGKGYYRLRVGDYRVLYSVVRKKVTVIIVKVAHRKEVYRKFRG